MSPQPRSPLPENEGPTFDFSHWCERHLQPFAPKVPGSQSWSQTEWVLATLGIFQVAVRLPQIQAAATLEPGGLAEVSMLDRVLREFSPLCCLVGDEETKKWTDLAFAPVGEHKKAIDALIAADKST